MAKREGSRTIDRRVFLKAAGVAAGAAAAGGIPGIVAAQKAPSFPKGTKLNIIRDERRIQAAVTDLEGGEQPHRRPHV
jgi:hypothetical protein